ncbi:hypothetical protein N7457_000805 [Penicillium paradoxum]|uniref:uncharacterized protein n=1 Tax=Penicillium paradoxum TaxID=176176 RepID=UPI002548FDE0|nr:uncharacterized protein N7457_000805 [Penicillium paradoxum]KAJ5794206.1 hypothetical protein N7457_000805 [Penicillium paradoxum]
MILAAPDSVYAKERTYYLNLLECQVNDLRWMPERHLQVIERLVELHNLTQGYITASHLLEDACFHQICCTLQPILSSAILTLRRDSDPVSGYRIADELENAVPLAVRDPLAYSRARAGGLDAV